MYKTDFIRVISQLPDKFELDVLLEKLVFVDEVAQGLRDIENSDTFTHKEVTGQVKTWRS